MRIHLLRSRKTATFDVMEKVVTEFTRKKVLELRHESGAAFLAWSESSEGTGRSVSVAIPYAWLEEGADVSKLEATTRNFAAYVASYSFPSEMTARILNSDDTATKDEPLSDAELF
jgi:hypothetical protein